MKKKNVSKKLALNKQMVSNLNVREMHDVLGGVDYNSVDICPNTADECATLLIDCHTVGCTQDKICGPTGICQTEVTIGECGDPYYTHPFYCGMGF